MLKRVIAAVLVVGVMAFFVMPVFAAEGAQDHKEAAAGGGTATAYLGFALGLGMALAAFGGAFGQGRAIAASVEAVARQPEAGGRIQGMMIIGLALIETLVIYMLLICFMWGSKVV